MIVPMEATLGDDWDQIFQDVRDIMFEGEFVDLEGTPDATDTGDLGGYRDRYGSGSDSNYYSDMEEHCPLDSSDLVNSTQALSTSLQSSEYIESTPLEFPHVDLEQEKIERIKHELPGYQLAVSCTTSAPCLEQEEVYANIPSPVLNHWPQQALPRRKRVRRCYKLWQFILDLLTDDTYRDFVRWVDRKQGIFIFVQSQVVATLWGEKKNKPSMTYEHLARAIRHYYKQQVMRRIPGRRLVYQFGPHANGWEELANGKR